MVVTCLCCVKVVSKHGSNGFLNLGDENVSKNIGAMGYYIDVSLYHCM